LWGSGSHETDSSLMVVPMEKELQTSLMHEQEFREGQRFANKTSQALSECIVPAFYMSRFTCFLSDSTVLFFWDHGLVGCPEISETMASTIGEGNGLPQTATGALASISVRVSDHLTALSAQGNPDPCLVDLSSNKGPQFIQFQGHRSWIGCIRSYHCLAQGWKLSGFFLIQATTVLREIPNVRSSPRRLLRSS
jgi:hypothetical protein